MLKNVTKNRLLYLLILGILLIVIPFQYGSAQSSPDMTLKSVNVKLIPEIKPSVMLVIIEFSLIEEAELPYELAFNFPVNAQNLQIINNEENSFITFNENPNENNATLKEIRFITPTPFFTIEYDDPNLFGEGNNRIFNYIWASPYPIESLSFSVQQPFCASEITSEPGLDPFYDQNAGMKYYSNQRFNIPAGEQISLSVTYQKENFESSYPVLDVEPAMEINQSTPGRTPSPLSVVMWLLTVAVVVLVVVSLYYWWFRNNIANQSNHTDLGVGIMNPEKQVIFCHECGKRSKINDSFCSNCGTELYKPSHFDPSGNLRR